MFPRSSRSDPLPLSKRSNTLYFRLEDSLPICPENLTDPWHEQINAPVPVNESIHSFTLTRMVCGLTEFVLVYDYYSWVYECLDSWCTSGKCLLGFLTVPFIFYKQSRTSYLLTPLSLHCPVKKDLPGGSHNSGFASFGRKYPG